MGRNDGNQTNQALLGAPATVHVWSDSDSDPSNGGTTLLASANTTVTNVDDDVFMKVNVSPTFVGNAGDNFFVGVEVAHVAGLFPASIDTTSSAVSSWVAGDTSFNLDPNNLTGADVPPLQIDAIGFAGNFMIRANAVAVPEPGCMGILAITGLAFFRRRR